MLSGPVTASAGHGAYNKCMNLAAQTSSAAASNPPPTRFVALEQGRIAYDDQGSGPLVVLVPGIGDLRREYRLVVPGLVAAGYRVVTMDLRGCGESDATFDQYDGRVIGDDIVALIRDLDAGPAIVVGTSIAAGSAVYAAAESPELVARIVLVGGFTRGPAMSAPMKLLVRVLMAGPWRNAVWLGVHRGLFPLHTPEDHDAHRAAIRANLREPGRSAALGRMMTSTHDHAEARYAKVRAPSLFVMGTADSDFPDPVAEANEVAAALGGRVAFSEGAGHYPHIEAPEQFLEPVLEFLAEAGA